MLSDKMNPEKLRKKSYDDEGLNWFQKRKGSFIVGGVILLAALAWALIMVLTGENTPSEIIAPGK